jgi:hypothetical protein
VTNGILRPGGPPAKSVGRTEGKFVFNGTVGVRHIVDKVQAEGRFSVLDSRVSKSRYAPSNIGGKQPNHRRDERFSRQHSNHGCDKQR